MARISGKGVYTRGTYGSVYLPEEMMENVKVIANGYGAYGDAGRLGGWDDFLITAKDDTLIKVSPSGGNHKMDSYWLYFGKEKVPRNN